VRYFLAWAHAALDFSEHYPVTVETVIRFVLDYVNGLAPDTDLVLIATGHKQRPGPLKLGTLDRYLASLSVAHQEQLCLNYRFQMTNGNSAPTPFTLEKLPCSIRCIAVATLTAAPAFRRERSNPVEVQVLSSEFCQ